MCMVGNHKKTESINDYKNVRVVLHQRRSRSFGSIEILKLKQKALPKMVVEKKFYKVC